ncbi:hypothetical protein EW661_22515, partial [Escherichia coli]
NLFSGQHGGSPFAGVEPFAVLLLHCNMSRMIGPARRIASTFCAAQQTRDSGPSAAPWARPGYRGDMLAFHYDNHALPLPPGHRFPQSKYRMLRE